MFSADEIIKAAAVISALGVILGLLIKAWRAIGRVSDSAKDLRKTLDDLKKHSDENYMSLLRLTIMSNEMPIGERIVAGHKYLKNGGNGETKKFLKEKFNIEETVDEADHYVK